MYQALVHFDPDSTWLWNTLILIIGNTFILMTTLTVCETSFFSVIYLFIVWHFFYIFLSGVTHYVCHLITMNIKQ